MGSFEDICISGVTVMSGLRPSGRSTDHSTVPRPKNGIFFVASGEARFWVENKEKIDVKAGELLFIPKGSRYKMQYTASNTAFVLVNLHIRDKNGNSIQLMEDIGFLAKDSHNNRISGIMANLELCGSSQSYATLFRRKELVYRLLGEVYKNGSVSSLQKNGYPQILAGVLLLEQSYLENLPVARFAEASGISISSFRSLFGTQYGMSPIQYRNQLRINRAAAILSEGSCTVSEAAYACGFENIGYFCRYYKKITGETPKETKLRHA